MDSRINDKIEQISRFLEELAEIRPDNFETYENNLEKKAACERYCEKIIECAVDIAFLIFKEPFINTKQPASCINKRDKNMAVIHKANMPATPSLFIFSQTI